MKLVLTLLASLMITGCAITVVADRSWARCDLLKIAFDEQDELSPGWYDYALQELVACGLRHYTPDASKDRGKM